MSHPTASMSLLALALLVLLSGGGLAEVSWTQVVEQILSADDYKVECHYRGPQGSYHLDYTVVRPGTIRALFLPGSKKNVGAVSIYDPTRSAGKVMMKFPGGGVVARKISHREIQGSPLHISILHDLVARTADCGEPTVEPAAKGGRKFRFSCHDGSTIQVWVDVSGNVTKSEVSKNQSVLEEVRLSGHEWNSAPTIAF